MIWRTIPCAPATRNSPPAFFSLAWHMTRMPMPELSRKLTLVRSKMTFLWFSLRSLARFHSTLWLSLPIVRRPAMAKTSMSGAMLVCSILRITGPPRGDSSYSGEYRYSESRKNIGLAGRRVNAGERRYRHNRRCWAEAAARYITPWNDANCEAAHTGASGAVGGVDADVFGGEVAGPVARDGFAGVKIDDDGNVVGKKFVAGGAFVEIEGLATFEDFDSNHGDFDERGIEFDAGAASGGEDSAPVGIAARESGFY